MLRGNPIYIYSVDARILTETAWRVSVLHGILPRVPTIDSAPYQKGMYALLLLVLSRPFRSLRQSLRGIIDMSAPHADEESVWSAVPTEFDLWRQDGVDNVASTYAPCQGLLALPPPQLWYSRLVGVHGRREVTQ